ncbi:hypothetical protein [Streptomyces alanosinicus]|uniref:hypothetical protein n=1 Tax=Streptomyces alanosinicus TaxID=68171 RepID=UPI0016726D49|nr:hypothetical protein [Streptomyces alanosinicus]
MIEEAQWQRAVALLADPREVIQYEGLRAVRDLARHLAVRRRAAEVLAEFVESPGPQPPVRAEALALLRQWVPARVRHARRRLLAAELALLVLQGASAVAATTAAGTGSETPGTVRVGAAAALALMIVLAGLCNVAVKRASARLDRTVEWRQRRHRELWGMSFVMVAMIGVSAGQGWAASVSVAAAGTLLICAGVLWVRLGSALTWFRDVSPGV